MAWNPEEWNVKEVCNPAVEIMVNKHNVNMLVVKKVMRNHNPSSGDARPLEIKFLALLPDSNRVIKPIFVAPSQPSPQFSTAIFRHYPLGDIHVWRQQNIPVPEPHIWRMFLQMAQAVAFIQKETSPSLTQVQRPVIVHRDIKPSNILVVDNGTTHPSFRLIDFGCACIETQHKLPARVGTYEWQPPENPYINTKAADIWSLGAVVYYMATGIAPIRNPRDYANDRFKELGSHPESASRYPSPDRYYAAKTPRHAFPINLSALQQLLQGVPLIRIDGIPRRIHQYSDILNRWMQACLQKSPTDRTTSRQLVTDMQVEAKEVLTQTGDPAALTDIDLGSGN
ncbi:kinase-like protein [Periconia macrospinosa]|uniref:non-specific serine/threonine protein kinase n=1 Tax=Periconia macrospinosa TaxID=97972 RepID=A0A2V1E957_9PLEO|nr:kinase-like protein [Periconia macrospinosa]